MPKTLARYQTALRRFLPWLHRCHPGATCHDVTPGLLDAYLAYLRDEHRARQDRALSDRSVHEYLCVLKLFARWGARGRRFWAVSPLQEYRLPGFVDRDIVPYTRAELAALLAAAGPGHTFMGRRLRVRSGVGRFRWHLMRHTAGTALLRNGADSLDVQEMLGHTTGEMTRRYLHLTDEDRRLRHARYSPVEELLGSPAGAPEPRVARFGRRTPDRRPPGRGPGEDGREAPRR